MPRISAFFGIVITMYHDDHPLPHFHARYGGQSVSIGIDPLTLLAGTLPPRALGQVVEWAVLHQQELLADWRWSPRTSCQPRSRRWHSMTVCPLPSTTCPRWKSSVTTGCG